MPRHANAILAAGFFAVLTACAPESAPTPAAEAPAAPAAEAAVETPVPELLVPAGEPQALVVEATEYTSAAASVVKVDFLENQGPSPGVKLFGTAGGDPAANGLYTYIAFYVGAGGDWVVFPVGNFIDYRILFEAPGRVDLEITETIIDEATSEMGSQTRRVIVNWTDVLEDAPPESVTVTPAQ